MVATMLVPVSESGMHTIGGPHVFASSFEKRRQGRQSAGEFFRR